MSERLTQEEMRRGLLCHVDTGKSLCTVCAVTSTDYEDAHTPGCPCDPRNVVVSRELLRDVWETLFGPNAADCEGWEYIRKRLIDALGEEPNGDE